MVNNIMSNISEKILCIDCGHIFNYGKPLEELKECPKCQTKDISNLLKVTES